MRKKKTADKFSESDRRWMRLTLAFAKRGGRTSPNPPVGAMIVRNGKILSTGFHRGPGTLHAEAEALRKLKGRAPRATLFVTLEPCCHTEKRTPPCVEALLTSGIRRVVVGVKDPNHLVNGKGIRRLRRGGLRVEEGCLREECGESIRAYGKWITTGNPYIILKSAMTLDGKIATAKGESHWITGVAARRKVHELRAEVDAVMVGFQTVMKDDPRLTVRWGRGRDPLRIVLDSRLELPGQRNIFTHLKKTPTILVALDSAKDHSRALPLQKNGVHLIFCPPNRTGRVDLNYLFGELGNRGITSVLVEGGAALASGLLEEGLADEIRLFMAPRVLGGDGLDLFSEYRSRSLKATPLFRWAGVNPVGEDYLLRLFPQK